MEARTKVAYPVQWETRLMTERWRPITGYEGQYSVSDHGRVRSEDRLIIDTLGRSRRWTGGILKSTCPQIRGVGRRYPDVALPVDGKQVKVRIHTLVAQEFIGPRPDGMEILHADDNVNNNHVSNLRYGTHADNGGDITRNRPACKNGHNFTPENTYLRPDTGGRQCRQCSRERQRQKVA